MNVIAFYETNVGRKATMAISGLTVVGWLFAHMLGNVAIYAGRDSYNAYAAFLADRPPILWGQRFVLTAALVVHIHAAITLWARSERARPTRYRVKRSVGTDYASKTMRWGGVTLLAFTVYHVLQTTVGMTGHLGYEFVQKDVYNNTVLGFMNPWVSAFYLISMAALSLHLYHGVWSITQSLGLDAPQYEAMRRRVATTAMLAIVIGFSV
ncbi:MAG TPA: succinate dehydrogenase cytochrome b subunit, partial [Polyangiales bacterium]|nr:succinate dehydrogenase cytochrome b subunit [Polyangiales bacterium]